MKRMETYVAVIILCEVLAVIGTVYGFLHEDKLIRFERALFGAVIRTIAEKVRGQRKGSC